MSTTLTPLHARLVELNISPAELAVLVHRSEEEVESWVTAADLPEEAKALTRFLATDVDALRRVEFLRRRRTHGPTDAERLGGVSPATAHGSGDAGRIDGTPA